jgi:hypothetical protein
MDKLDQARQQYFDSAAAEAAAIPRCDECGQPMSWLSCPVCTRGLVETECGVWLRCAECRGTGGWWFCAHGWTVCAQAREGESHDAR